MSAAGASSKATYLRVGGLVAMGFDATGAYLLVASHSGRGVFSVGTWERVARDPAPIYPSDGCIEGIGPLAGTKVAVDQRDQTQEQVRLRTSDGRFEVLGESDGITITSLAD